MSQKYLPNSAENQYFWMLDKRVVEGVGKTVGILKDNLVGPRLQHICENHPYDYVCKRSKRLVPYLSLLHNWPFSMLKKLPLLQWQLKGI